MARPPRIEFPGALYHVTTRGEGEGPIFREGEDREILLELLAEVVEASGWILHAWCLMDNHYHLLAETPAANLGRGMRQLNGMYTQRFNQRHDRSGRVFRGRYKPVLAEKDRYLLELARHIVLNPVRAGLVDDPGQWLWSSYRPTLGLDPQPPWLTVEEVLGALAPSPHEARQGYRHFVAEGLARPSPWGKLTGQMFLGSEDFVRRAREELGPAAGRDRPRPGTRSLAELAADHPRDRAIVHAHIEEGYTLQEIGAFFGLHYSRISRIVREKG